MKGIRNIRHLEDVLIDKVVHCAVDNNVKARVRAAALEAFQADPCSAKVSQTPSSYSAYSRTFLPLSFKFV